MKRTVLLLIISALSGLWASAQSIREQDLSLLDKIKEKNTSYTSIRADFSQTKHLPFLDEDILSQGKYLYVKPDKLSMEYTDPAGDLMLMEGDKFTMIAGGKKSETTARNARMRDMRTILAAAMEGDIRKAGPTAVTCSETSKSYVVTADLPAGKANKSNIVKVTVHYDRTDCSISTLRTEEADGTYNEYRLNNKTINK